MKLKILSAITAIVLLFSLMPLSAAAETKHQIEEKALTLYVGAIDSNTEFPFYFMDGVEDLPWVELNAWCDLLNLMYHAYLGDENYALTYEQKGNEIILKRENGYSMTVDFAEGTIAFDDYNMFLHASSDTSLQDILTFSGFNEAGESELFQRNTKGSFDRQGDELLLELTKDYEIEIILQDGKGYVPFQTMGDLITSPHFLLNPFYNGKAAFLGSGSYFGDAASGLTPVGELYYSAEPTERSEALADYGYRELCLALDVLYGLKDVHEITSFDTLFWQIGYDESLRDTDPWEADAALYDFIDYYLDDLHSAFLGYSWMSGREELDGFYGTASTRYNTDYERYHTERAKWLGDSPYKYQEVGNTAYVLFDEFTASIGTPYYEVLNGGQFPDDTIGLIIYAHSMIYRKDSPIQNVVIDLSCNGGGAVDAALFVMSWVLGEAPFCVKNTSTGAFSTVLYRGDTNLDRQFDSMDEVDDKNIFCLISPLSFSCGNLVPAVFKNSQKVTLLGRTSGGGSCTVQPMSTAWGSMFQISGPSRMSFFKNGSFYDIDQGVEPDIYLSHLSSFYDRETLTKFINGLI